MRCCTKVSSNNETPTSGIKAIKVVWWNSGNTAAAAARIQSVLSPTKPTNEVLRLPSLAERTPRYGHLQ
jgi:hypothetical protein